jgi:(p)ppGpp synthase/HD superfamily hydrolase
LKVAGREFLVAIEAVVGADRRMSVPYGVDVTDDRKPLLTDRFDRALVYASELHRTQIRKCTQIPYISHLLAVASIVLEHGGSEDQAIAALLHDAVEDQGGAPTLDEIRRRFGDTVGDIVEACTDAAEDAGADRAKSSWPRKQAYLDHLNAGAMLEAALLVSAADKLHNARSILADLRTVGAKTWDRFNVGRDLQLRYYRGLADALEHRAPKALADELVRVVGDIEREASTGRW